MFVGMGNRSVQAIPQVFVVLFVCLVSFLFLRISCFWSSIFHVGFYVCLSYLRFLYFVVSPVFDLLPYLCLLYFVGSLSLSLSLSLVYLIYFSRWFSVYVVMFLWYLVWCRISCISSRFHVGFYVSVSYLRLLYFVTCMHGLNTAGPSERHALAVWCTICGT